jgi:hypothetical protein
MDSPFPGMDPYLEDPAFWADFHITFIGCWREAIAEVLPDAYEARLDETIHVVPVAEDVIKLIYPDVAVSRSRKQPRKRARGVDAGTALLEPVVIPHEMVQEVRQTRIEILHRPGRKVVTILEALSPTNKSGEGFVDFCAKRVAILRQKTNLVELDLLLGGRRLPLSKPLPAGDYFVLISRGERWPDCEVYSWAVRQSLPTIPIPLLPPDADVQVDLQSVFQQTFRRGRYGRSLPYGQAPKAPLKANRIWAVQTGRRKR